MRKRRLPMPSSAHRPIKILAIDDEPVIRDSIAAYLEDSGFNVLQAGDGQQGLTLFREHTPDLVLLDLRMPEMDGLAFLEALRQEGADTFVYQLDFPSPLQPELGAPHTFDIPLVFRNLDAAGSITGTGKNAVAVSAMMSEAFISFAATGAPSSQLLPEWTPFSLPARPTMVFDLPPRIENDPRGAEREIFERVPYVQPGT